MSSNFNRPLKFEVTLPSEHPHLLQGLDEWLRLNLISDSQVRQFCWEYLTCRVILEPQILPQKPPETVAPQPRKPAEKPKLTATPSLFSSMWHSLRAEFSVRWLLFLGIFTVVVSSGALAASQWERFTAFLQYGVLFAYTLLFWGLSFWTGKQANLRLTSAALHIVTMLLIPINFWAMDGLGLWRNPINWLLVGIASISLTGITALLAKQSIFTGSIPVSKLSFINILGLSYLHWGWRFTGFPLIAVYLAFIGTTIITVFQNLQADRGEGEEKRIIFQSSWGKNLPATIIIYSSIILLLRAIIGAGINISQLGLAIGICGWLIAWLAQREDKETSTKSENSPPSLTNFPSETIGGILLLLGWLVTVWNNPLQAIAVSGLGLWFFHSRLYLYSLRSDLTAFFAIGLQSICLGWRLLPDNFHSSIITFATQFTNSQDNPWALLSVGLFPYIIFMVAFTDRLYQKNKPDLASFGEILTLILGLILTAIAITNPILRSLNLLLSTITLAIVTHQHFHKIFSPPSPSSLLPLTYLTHISAILTLFSWINLFFPSLSQQIWAVVCLVVMVAEWLFSVGNGMGCRSAWHIGLMLAGSSYLLLLTNLQLGNSIDFNPTKSFRLLCR
ncbi:MAG: hypothetical protein AAFS12_13100 [Cyanobacteria bacterium J06632_19]